MAAAGISDAARARRGACFGSPSSMNDPSPTVLGLQGIPRALKSAVSCLSRTSRGGLAPRDLRSTPGSRAPSPAAPGRDAPLLRGRSFSGVLSACQPSTGRQVVGGLRVNHSVDGIADCVRSLLTSDQGDQQARFNQLVAQVAANIPELRRVRARLRQRAGMQLYINVSTAKTAGPHQSVRLSVRVHGRECGRVTVGSDGGACLRAEQPTGP